MSEIIRSRIPKTARKQYYSSNASTSSVITLTQDTTAIEMVATTVPAAIRWIATTDTAGSVVGVPGATANWDHILPAGETAFLPVPIEANGTTYGSVVGVNRERGLYRRIAYISLGIGSVLTAEFMDERKA
uniref:Uncharacterized protein n=1 Tax=viral metagenome TaxID=1070528 RepID=A0A6M3J6T3_9ZZZZ